MGFKAQHFMVAGLSQICKGALLISVAIFIATFFHSEDLAPIVFSFAINFSVVQISAAGWKEVFEECPKKREAILNEALLLGVLVSIPMSGGLIGVFLLNDQVMSPILSMYTLANCIVGTVAQILMFAIPEGKRMIPQTGRILIFLLGIFGLQTVGGLTAENVAGLLLTLNLVAFAWMLWRLPQPVSEAWSWPRKRLLSKMGTSVLRYIDLLLVPFILEPANAIVFVAARVLAHLVSQICELFAKHVSARLAEAYVQNANISFVAGVARANLGILLIGGGVALFVLTLPNFLNTFWELPDAFRTVVPWLVLANLGSVIFGIAPHVLQIGNAYRTLITISWGLTPLLILALSLADDVISVAMSFALIQLLFSMLCAAEVARRFGIWPGVTALFFRQIRLF